jgi:hypothetical protein
MKRNNVSRTVLMVLGGIAAVLAMWSLDGGAALTITFEEAVIGLLFSILAVLVINGGER